MWLGKEAAQELNFAKLHKMIKEHQPWQWSGYYLVQTIFRTLREKREYASQEDLAPILDAMGVPYADHEEAYAYAIKNHKMYWLLDYVEEDIDKLIKRVAKLYLANYYFDSKNFYEPKDFYEFLVEIYDRGLSISDEQVSKVLIHLPSVSENTNMLDHIDDNEYMIQVYNVAELIFFNQDVNLENVAIPEVIDKKYDMYNGTQYAAKIIYLERLKEIQKNVQSHHIKTIGDVIGTYPVLASLILEALFRNIRILI